MMTGMMKDMVFGLGGNPRRSTPSSHPSHRNSNGGFTIVEMLVVIAIIAILAGAITMGVSGMFYKSRMGRALAIQNILQSGLETYYAQQGDWPGKLESISQNPSGDKDYIELTHDEADSCFRKIVDVSWGKNATPVLDPSGLYIIDEKNLKDPEGCSDIHRSWEGAKKLGVVSVSDHKCDVKRCVRGRDFSEATKKDGKNPIRSVQNMVFGYAGPNHGRFCRFRIRYYPKSDTVRVHLQKATEFLDSRRDRYGYVDD